MRLQDFRPRPQLVTRQSRIERPRFPVIDAHGHLGDEFGGGLWRRGPAELLSHLDEAGVERFVDLDGGWGEDVLDQRLAAFKERAPDRYAVFGGVDWSAWPARGAGFGEWAAARLRAQVARGAQGLKIWKPLGLSVRDERGALVAVDDSRLDPLWQAAGELDVPVLIHVADPPAYFEPVDEENERWEQLHDRPDRRLLGPEIPPFRAIVEALARLVQRHPAVDFIGAHVGCYAEDLAWVGALLDRCPNFHIDLSARVAELGRQPYSARRLFVRHSDRILFGTDAKVDPEQYRLHYRFLETDDEHFNYWLGRRPHQGRWRIYGLHLPDEVLERVYRRNAERLIFQRPARARR